MRILSARVTRARLDRDHSRVDAIIALSVQWQDMPVRAYIRISAPARAPGGATLRARLIAAAKLTFASDPVRHAPHRAA